MNVFRAGSIYMVILFMSMHNLLSAQDPKNTLDEAAINVEKLFIEANRDKILGKTEDAIEGFEQVLKEDAKNSTACFELARLFRKDKKMDKAMLYAEQAVEYAPYNLTFNKLYVYLLEREGQFKKAADTYTKLLEKYPDEERLYLECAYFNAKNNKADQALKIYNNLEKRQGIRPTTSIRKYSIYKDMNKFKKAVQELERLVEAYPFETEYLLRLANFYQASGDSQNAKIYYQKTLDIDPANSNANLALIDYFLQNGDTTQYLRALVAVFENSNYDVKSKLTTMESLLVNLENDKMTTHLQAIQNLAEQLSQMYPDITQANVFNAEIYFVQAKYNKALVYYKKALNLQENKLQLWKRMLECLRLTNNKEELIKYSSTLLDLYPGQACSHYYQGVALLYQTDYLKAEAALKMALDIAYGDKDLSAAASRYLAWTYHRMHQSEKASKAFEASLELQPDNQETLYFKAQVLLEQKKDVEKSLKMLQSIVAANPDNYRFRSTYAWMLYQQASYKQAAAEYLFLLEKGGTEDATLLERYGDTLFQLQQKEKALSYWQKAMNKGSKSTLLPKKIASKQLYE